MDYSVTLNAAVNVNSVSTEDEAVQISISKVGEMLNPDMGYVDINTQEDNTVLVAAGEALVSLRLSMVVFDVDEEEHAERVAKKEIGEQLDGISLSLASVDAVESEDE